MMKRLEDHFAEMSENYISTFADRIVADFAERGSRSALDVVHEVSALLPVAASPDQMEADGLLFASCSNPTPVTQRQFIATLWSVS